MRLLRNISAVIILALLPMAAFAQTHGLDTKAKYAIMVDYDTGAVLYSKNADESVGPSSMSKLMTLYLVFDAVKSGVVSMDDAFTVSEKAWRKGGSKMFVEVNKRVKVGDLIKGIAIQSGNDACIVVAEGLAGSEEKFVSEMNVMAERLGMSETNFENATGWPDEGHVMSVRDLATLARALINDFPEYMKFFSIEEYTYNGIRQYNRNLLLKRNIGVDGMKTGHTSANGYGIVLTAKNEDDRRLILVLNGLESAKDRVSEGARLLRHGYRDFKHIRLFKAGDEVAKAKVWFGSQSTVPLQVRSDVVFTVRKRLQRHAGEVRAELIYDGPIAAPIKAGDRVGKVVIYTGGEKGAETFPVFAAESVDKANRLMHMFKAAVTLIVGS